MTGPVVLHGGGEFSPENEDLDNLLVRAAGGPGIPIVILPTAAAHYRPDLLAKDAVEYLERLGHPARSLMVLDRMSANDLELAAAVAGARLIYLTDGDPSQLRDTFYYSAVWDAVQQAQRENAALLAASGASAMALGAFFWDAAHGGVVPGLGLLPGVAVFPHYENQTASVIQQYTQVFPAGTTLVAIPDHTALAWDGQIWTVIGARTITLYRPDRVQDVAPDETVDDLPGPESS